MRTCELATRHRRSRLGVVSVVSSVLADMALSSHTSPFLRLSLCGKLCTFALWPCCLLRRLFLHAPSRTSTPTPLVWATISWPCVDCRTSSCEDVHWEPQRGPCLRESSHIAAALCLRDRTGLTCGPSTYVSTGCYSDMLICQVSCQAAVRVRVLASSHVSSDCAYAEGT